MIILITAPVICEYMLKSVRPVDWSIRSKKMAMNIVLENRAFFSDRRRKTIVLTLSLASSSQLAEFHSICINVPEDQLVRQLLVLQQMAHGGGRNMPPMPRCFSRRY